MVLVGDGPISGWHVVNIKMSSHDISTVFTSLTPLGSLTRSGDGSLTWLAVVDGQSNSVVMTSASSDVVPNTIVLDQPASAVRQDEGSLIYITDRGEDSSVRVHESDGSERELFKIGAAPGQYFIGTGGEPVVVLAPVGGSDDGEADIIVFRNGERDVLRAPDGLVNLLTLTADHSTALMSVLTISDVATSELLSMSLLDGATRRIDLPSPVGHLGLSEDGTAAYSGAPVFGNDSSLCVTQFGVPNG